MLKFSGLKISGCETLGKWELTPWKLEEIIGNNKAEIRWNYFCFTLLAPSSLDAAPCSLLHAATRSKQQSAARRNNVQLSHAAPYLFQKHFKQKKLTLPAGFEPATHHNLWNLTAML